MLQSERIYEEVAGRLTTTTNKQINKKSFSVENWDHPYNLMTILSIPDEGTPTFQQLEIRNEMKTIYITNDSLMVLNQIKPFLI